LQRIAQYGHDGVMAFDRGDATATIREFKNAEPLIRPGDSNSDFFFTLGSAYLDTGKDAEAATYFERIVKSGTLRANDPLPFVRSLYLLGQISEHKGDRAKAADYYRRFVQYWGDGDMDRERVAEARKKLAAG
jgi:tetratricopeptide (TPR) repeat protein